MSHVTYYERVMSHMNVSCHSCHRRRANERRALVQIRMSHVTYYERVMSHMNVSCHTCHRRQANERRALIQIRMSHVTVTSHMDESRHTCHRRRANERRAVSANRPQIPTEFTSEQSLLILSRKCVFNLCW